MFNVNGVSGSNNSTRIDGVSDIYAWLPEITAYTPSTEAISSVNVVTNSMNAEQGFASGAAVNVTTKSGTNVPRLSLGIQHDQRSDGKALLHAGDHRDSEVHPEPVRGQLRRPDQEE